MGTKVQSLPGYYSMRDLNEESSSCGWPLYYGDKTLANGQYYHNYLSSAAADVCSAHDKDVVKQMMLEHEAIFKNQVFELHRLYRIQRDLMDEVKMKDLHRNQISVETSFSTGPLASQITSEDGKKWHIPGFPLVGSSTCSRPSMSGVEGIHYPLSSNKGINKQAGLFPSPNGSSSKDVEILGFRPSKVRRKMFDLHLPADEYIDTEENEKPDDEKISGTTKFLSDRNCKPEKEGDAKLFYGNGGKTGSQEDISRPEQSLRSGTCLADLNEPVHVEETNDVAYVPPQNHNPYQGATESSDLSTKQKSRFFGLSKENLLNSHHGTDSWAQNNGYLENDRSGKMWISSIESGQAKSNLKPIPQVLKQEQSLLSSQTMRDALSKAHEPTSDYLTNRSKVDLLREKTASGLDISERNREYPTNKHPESVVSSHRPGLFAVAPSSDLARSWSHSSWEMASSNLNQKLISVQTPLSPCLNASGALSRSSQSHQSNGILGDSWPLNINSKLNPSFQCETSGKNGLYPGTSSGSKELSVNISSISYLNHGHDYKKFLEPFNNGSANCYKSSNLNSNCNDMKSAKDINLNEILSNGSSNNLVSQSGLGIMDREQKDEEQLAVLPWLRAKTTCKNEAQNVGRSLNAGVLNVFQVASLSNNDETGKWSSGKFMHNITPGLCSNDIEPTRTEVSESSSKRKILGVPLFDIPHISAKESSSFTSPSVLVPNPSDVELVENNRKKQIFDINLPCDAAVPELDEQAVTEIIVCETGSSTTKANSRNQIDLNLSMSEDEAFPTTIPATSLETQAEIDLEAPAVPEIEEDAIPEEKKLESPLVSPLGSQDTVEKLQDELMRYAAEAIVVLSSSCCHQVDDVISSPSETPVVDPLSWFVDIVSSCVDDLQKKTGSSREKDSEDNEESSSEGMDYFESMTLKLTETKEEDYMPQPLVPENFKVEETGTTSLPTRTRKGPARRGRQRRDFQRDILPGLASLSRHEVTEDLQTFGGLMRATGHAWHSGLNRRSSSRNGCGRGRRRSQPQVTPSPSPPVATIETSTPLIQQLNNIEVGLEDRSLTGWGKTTRRPRRQRCPAGNPPSIRLI
ncbi:inorganic phosphate transporter 1-4 [Spatholobus suberectus]|nr:inorganic phosphate transporter 1-4 [Spatholobus suberectus]